MGRCCTLFALCYRDMSDLHALVVFKLHTWFNNSVPMEYNAYDGDYEVML